MLVFRTSTSKMALTSGQAILSMTSASTSGLNARIRFTKAPLAFGDFNFARKAKNTHGSHMGDSRFLSIGAEPTALVTAQDLTARYVEHQSEAKEMQRMVRKRQGLEPLSGTHQSCYFTRHPFTHLKLASVRASERLKQQFAGPSAQRRVGVLCLIGALMLSKTSFFGIVSGPWGR